MQSVDAIPEDTPGGLLNEDNEGGFLLKGWGGVAQIHDTSSGFTTNDPSNRKVVNTLGFHSFHVQIVQICMTQNEQVRGR